MVLDGGRSSDVNDWGNWLCLENGFEGLDLWCQILRWNFLFKFDPCIPSRLWAKDTWEGRWSLNLMGSDLSPRFSSGQGYPIRIFFPEYQMEPSAFFPSGPAFLDAQETANDLWQFCLQKIPPTASGRMGVMETASFWHLCCPFLPFTHAPWSCHTVLVNPHLL